MGLVDSIAKRLGYEKKESIKKYSAVLDATYSDPLLGYQKPEGIADFLDVYRTHPWVNACVDKVAEAVSSVPFKLYRKIDDQIEEITEGELFNLFQGINDYTTVHDFWEELTIDLEVTGNFFAEIEYGARNEPIALHHMRPDLVQIWPDPEKRVSSYTYTVNGIEKILTPDKVIHLYYYDPSSALWGLSPLTSLSLTLVSDFYARAYNRRFFENDASVPAVLETEQNLDDKDIEMIQTTWKSAHQGVDRSHKVALLWNGLHYKETGLAPKDAQFLELIKINREEICAALGVPPAVVGIFEYANYANSEAQIKMFWHDKILPLLTKIEQMVTEQLIKRFDQDAYGAFDTSVIEALREDESKTADTDIKLVGAGLATINERRALKDLEPVEWGDTGYLPMSWMPAGEIEQEEPTLKIERDMPHPLRMGRKEIKKYGNSTAGLP